MQEQLSRSGSFVKLSNSPAITCVPRLDLDHFESQSDSPRLNQRLPKLFWFEKVYYVIAERRWLFPLLRRSCLNRYGSYLDAPPNRLFAAYGLFDPLGKIG